MPPISNYFSEFITVAIVHFLAMASPGPDFVMVVRQSVAFGRKAGMWTSLGIATGLTFHLIYSILGISLLIAHSPTAFMIAKLIGAGYLAYIGIQCLRAKASLLPKLDFEKTNQKSQTPFQAFTTGVLTNAFNPKVALFFLALFTVVIQTTTPAWIKVGYGIWMIIVNIIWFDMIACVFSQKFIHALFEKTGLWFERIMGAILLFLAIQLILSKL